MRTVYEHQSVKLEQSDARGKLFRVTYGLQVKQYLTYAQACEELGACLLHQLACDGLIDNDGD